MHPFRIFRHITFSQFFPDARKFPQFSNSNKVPASREKFLDSYRTYVLRNQ